MLYQGAAAAAPRRPALHALRRRQRLQLGSHCDHCLYYE